MCLSLSVDSVCVCVCVCVCVFWGVMHQYYANTGVLYLQDQDGNTVFHTLTELSATRPSKSKTYLVVFQALLDEVSECLVVRMLC